MKLTISGEVPSQKNQKIISTNRATGRPFLRSAPAVKAWQESARLQLQSQFSGYEVTGYPISIACVVFYGSERRKDLDNSLNALTDALVASGVIVDDSYKYIDCITMQFGGIDKKNPRAEIYIDE